MTMRDDHRKSPRDSTHLLRKLNLHCAAALGAVGNLVDDELRNLLAIEHELAARIGAQDDPLVALAEIVDRDDVPPAAGPTAGRPVATGI